MQASPSSAPHSLPAGRGWAWLVRGWNLFAREPIAWILAILALAIIALVIIIIPRIGPFVWSVVGPVFSAGLLHAARRADQGEKPAIDHLFQGFRAPGRLVPLLTLGAMTLALSLFANLLTPDLRAAFDPANLEPGQAPGREPGMLSGMLVLTLVELLVLMGLFFAVPRVLFDEVAPLEAVKSSLIACVKNLLPLTLFSLAGTVLAILALIPMGLGLLILMPVSVAATYYAYTEVYDTGESGGEPGGQADGSTRIEA